MSSKLTRFIFRWVNTTVAVLVASKIVSGIDSQRPIDLVVAALLLGILNAFLRPILMFFSLPLLIVTLGLFTFVINALLLYLVGWMMQPHFVVNTFKAAFLGGLVITIISLVLNLLIGTSNTRVNVHRGRPPRDGGDGGGPVIDV